MRDVKCAYRSLFPERTAAAVRDAKTNREAAIAAINDFTDAKFAGLQPNGQPYPQMTASASFLFDGSICVTGFDVLDGFASDVEPPLGMRYDKKDKRLAPAKLTPEGKALAKDMAALGFRFPVIDGLGGIVHATNGGSRSDGSRQGYFTGWTFHVLERDSGLTEVYATLSVEVLDERPQQRVIDEGIDGALVWEKVRLSTFHAALEEHEDRTKVGAA